jgi:hypothetical protein
MTATLICIDLLLRGQENRLKFEINGFIKKIATLQQTNKKTYKIIYE